MAAAKKKEPKVVEPEVVAEAEVEAPAEVEVDVEAEQPEVVEEAPAEEVEVEEAEAEVSVEAEPEVEVEPAHLPDASAVRREDDGQARDAGGNPVHVGIFGAGDPHAPDDRARTRA